MSRKTKTPPTPPPPRTKVVPIVLKLVRLSDQHVLWQHDAEVIVRVDRSLNPMMTVDVPGGPYTIDVDRDAVHAYEYHMIWNGMLFGTINMETASTMLPELVLRGR